MRTKSLEARIHDSAWIFSIIITIIVVIIIFFATAAIGLFYAIFFAHEIPIEYTPLIAYCIFNILCFTGIALIIKSWFFEPLAKNDPKETMTHDEYLEWKHGGDPQEA